MLAPIADTIGRLILDDFFLFEEIDYRQPTRIFSEYIDSDKIHIINL